jgi:WD40 repeat protein
MQRKRILSWGLVLIVLVSCAPVNSKTGGTMLSSTATSTAFPAPHIIDIGNIGQGEANYIAWSSNGALMAVASSSGIFIYDTKSWLVKKHVESRASDFVSFQPGEYALYYEVNEDGAVYRYDLETDQSQQVYPALTIGPRVSIIFAPSGKTFASLEITSTENGQTVFTNGLDIHDASSGQVLRTLLKNVNDQDVVESAAFSPNERLLAAGSNDHLVRVWDLTNGKLLYEGQQESTVYSVTFSPDGQVLASAGEDAKVQLWDARSGRNLATLQGFTAGIEYISYAANGSELLVGLEDGTFQKWSVDSHFLPQEKLPLDLKVPLVTERGDNYPYLLNCLSPDGNQLATLNHSDLEIWDLSSGRSLVTLGEFNDVSSASALSPDGSLLAVGDTNIHLWDAKSRTLINTFHANAYQIHDLVFRRDGSQLALASGSDSAQIWNIATGEKVNLTGDGLGSNLVAYSRSGEQLATASSEGVAIWNSNTGQLLRRYPEDMYVPLDLAFSDDGKNVMVVSSTGIWRADISTNDIQQINSSELKQVTILDQTGSAFFFAGNHLAVLQSNGTLSIWDTTSFTHLYDIEIPPSGSFGYPSFSVDARGQILAVKSNGEILLYDLASGQALSTIAITDNLEKINISADGNTLVNAQQVWDISGVLQMASVIRAPTPTTLPTAMAISSDTPTPAPTIFPLTTETSNQNVISAANANNLVRHDAPVLGTLTVGAWSPDGQWIALGSSEGVYINKVGEDHPTQFFASNIPDSWVATVSISADDRFLASQISNYVMEIWDIKSGARIFKLSDYCWSPLITFTQGDQALIAECGNGSVLSWNLLNGQVLEDDQPSHPWDNLSPDGQLGITAGRLVTVKTGAILHTFDIQGMRIGALEFSPDGKTLLAWYTALEKTSSDMGTAVPAPPGFVQLWQVAANGNITLQHTLATGDVEVAFPGDRQQGYAFTHDSHELATAGLDGAIRIWDVSTGQLLSMAKGEDVSQVMFAPDDQSLLALNSPDLVEILDVDPNFKLSLHSNLKGFSGTPISLTFSSDSSVLTASFYNGTMLHWKLDASGVTTTPSIVNALTQSYCVITSSADGSYWATEGIDGGIAISDAQTGNLIRTLPSDISDVSPDACTSLLSLTFTPDGQLLAAMGPDGLNPEGIGLKSTINIWQTDNGQNLLRLYPSFYPEQMNFNQDGSMLAVSSEGDSQAEIWNVKSGKSLGIISPAGSYFAFGPDNTTIATGQREGTFMLENLRSGSTIWRGKSQDLIDQIIFSPDERLLAIATDSVVELWDVQTGKRLNVLPSGGVSQLAFSPDGTNLAVGTFHGIIQLWSVPNTQ